ncbi:hypothetical protein [Nocardia sp. NPDC058705]|uniref:hypothetical protein n=1 Tax=Nocardia sp. NPDC058705 TaxID=3346609 RepID=UPI0036D0D373
MIAAPNKPETLPMPEDVGTARQLWWATAALGIVYTFASVFTMAGERGELSKQFLDDMRKSDPNFAASTADTMVLVGFVVIALVGSALVAGATVAFAHQLGRGKTWARTVLMVIAVWLGLGAVTTMFTFSAVANPATIIAGGTAIVQGVLAAGAAYLSYRPESTKYFLAHRK